MMSYADRKKWRSQNTGNLTQYGKNSMLTKKNQLSNNTESKKGCHTMTDKSFLFEVGDFNIELYPANVYKDDERYHLLVITKFRNNIELSKHSYYIHQGQTDEEEKTIQDILKQKENIENIIGYMDKTRLILTEQNTLISIP